MSEDKLTEGGSRRSETSDELIASDQLGLPELGPIDLYQKREKIYTRSIAGFFQRIRTLTGWPLLLGYFIAPWLQMDGRQAVLFDLPERKFHIFWLTFWPQDFPLLAWLLIIAAFALFAVTNFAGRVWCGYTCPQTVWTAIFMWAEQLTEGERNQRIKLDAKPWNPEKVARKSAKHLLWLGFAFLTGYTFIAYFAGAREMLANFFVGDSHMMVYAWTLFFTLATYINAGWLREQVCLYMCPYARFQSAMFDQDTLIVSYDRARGEPRGSRKRFEDHRAQGKGDCIDCKLCVQVCPTGIDIREGLQYECITCALCIDACDSVMDKMNYPRGLIRYTTQKNLEGGKTRLLRPKMIGYLLVMALMLTIFATTLATRSLVRLDVIRDRAELFEVAEDGRIENIYQLRILNLAEQPREFRISYQGIDGLEMQGNDRVQLGSGESLTHPVRLLVNPEALSSPVQDVEFRVRAVDNPRIEAIEEGRFVGPTN